PRIHDLAEMEEHLKALVPEIKIVTAHGQLSPQELENKIDLYYQGEYELLLATNIIESGLDIPNANTLIVHRADMFGLAQLYQLRGRIGRGKVRGYAYLTYKENQHLTKNAVQRLQFLERLENLGAG